MARSCTSSMTRADRINLDSASLNPKCLASILSLIDLKEWHKNDESTRENTSLFGGSITVQLVYSFTNFDCITVTHFTNNNISSCWVESNPVKVETAIHYWYSPNGECSQHSTSLHLR